MDPTQHASGINYFTCTLGQAADYMKQRSRDFNTVNTFLDARSRDSPDDYAVGIPLPSESPSETDVWRYRLITFSNLRYLSIQTAYKLREMCHLKASGQTRSSSKTVALLCPSSLDFLLAWLGLIRLGYCVLLVAPQCQASAIAHLCKTCDVKTLIYHPVYKTLAEASESAGKPGSNLDIARLADFSSSSLLTTPASKEALEDCLEFTKQSELDTAFLFHTSGTSTGLPKPIPQSHKAAVGVLPCLDDGRHSATFTTTPLYHGGIADCFRSWTSGALVWLFPGKDVPITATNVLRTLDCAEIAYRECQSPSVRYFSSVPYVLQMVATESRGLDVLKSMEIVGVGGATLPQAAGNDLVQRGVNLVSRFGSAECGFLMSSHRDYENDKEWQYLRSCHGSETLRFEPAQDGLAELVILPQWPHMAKRNRDDGSFATADLFAAHPTIIDAWKYHSRADSQLTLITGKKFDPAPLEAAMATSPLLSDVFIFGNGQQYPGALLFRSEMSESMGDADLLSQIWPHIESINSEGQAHTRISRSMLVIMPTGASGLEKSSKGTILRGQAERQYQSVMAQAYDDCNASISGIENQMASSILLDDEVPLFVLEIIKKVTGITDSISEDADLFSLGVDSVACMQIRAKLQQRTNPSGVSNLPLNVVYDSGSIRRLSKYLIEFRKGQATEVEDEIQLMLDLVGEHSTFSNKTLPTAIPEAVGSSNGNIHHTGKIVLLTGATGALGAYILSQLRFNTKVSQIYCLVRASSPHAAHERISKSLLARGQPGLDTTPLPSGTPTVRPVIYTIGAPLLGLSQETYTNLAKTITVIIHAAWAVNFSLPLRSFAKEHVRGLHNLLTLSITSSTKPQIIFCSSTASVISSSSNTIHETISHDPTTSSKLGYSRSKWVAEAICNNACLHTDLGGRVKVVRVGQLCGYTETGIWNTSEAWPLMLSTARLLGCLPKLDERLGWLAVDVAAKAVIEIAFSEEQASAQIKTNGVDKKSCPIYHVLNPNDSTTWNDLLSWIQKLSPNITTVPVNEWLTKLENLEGEAAKHPARKLLGLWRETYTNDTQENSEQGKEEIGKQVEQGKQRGDITWEMTATRAIAPVMRDVAPVSEEQVGKMWRWIETEMM